MKQDSEMGANFMTFQEMLEQEGERNREEGQNEKALEIARALKAEGIGIDVIQKTTGLSVEEIKRL